MTTTTTIEIEQYYERVQAALAGIEPEIRDDLLDDLPDHLAEVQAEIVAEGAGSLRERLGEPEAYADELRAAAGIEAAETPPAVRDVQARVAERVRRLLEVAGRLDRQTGRLVGYPKLSDLLRAVRPGWWVLRGWIVAQFVSGAHDRGSWQGFIPRLGGNSLIGLIATLALIAASVWVGRQSLRFQTVARCLVIAASVVIALWGASVLARNVGGTAYAYSSPNDAYSPPGAGVGDVYAYDQNGKPVPGARLYDQGGNPIQLGSPYCADGTVGSGAGRDGTAQTWTYPLCPQDIGPFRSGPGPAVSVAPNSAAPNSAPPTSTAGASSSATSAAPNPAAPKPTVASSVTSKPKA